MANMNAFLKTAVVAATQAGSLLKQGLGKAHKIGFKGEINLVTEMDTAAEKLIYRIIFDRYPKHAMLSEEKGRNKIESDYKWIIDPLDGTTNYAHSYPVFAVSIALEIFGEIALGVIYDPTRDELFTCIKNKGAYLNKRKIRISQIASLKRSLLATGFAYIRDVADKNIGNFSNFIKKAQAIRRAGAASLDLAYVACGRYDGFWELNLNPWDIAAGKLLVEEAGGQVSAFDGKKYSHYNPDILASNKKIHAQMVNVLLKGSGQGTSPLPLIS